MSDDDKGTPSLLENESRGGEVAQGGFTFQDGVLVAHIPEWLAHDGFAALVRESVGDTEVKFFAPGWGELLNLIEAKNHRVTPAEFWKEVQRFRRVDEGAKGQYRLFTLACTGLSEEVEAVVNALQRVRGPISFYGTASAVVQNSLEDFTKLVVGHGHTEGEARFLLDKVIVLRDFSPVQRYAEGLFQEAVARWLPAYAGLPLQAFRAVFAALLALVRSRVNQPITRLELKRTLRGAIDSVMLPPLPSVAIHTATEENVGQPSHLCFHWGDFFGGPERHYPPAAEWDQRVLGQLRVAKQWVMDNRSVRRVALHGERRLSTSVAIGAVFSAVAGFAIDLDHRGEVWATDAHPDSDTPAYPLILSLENGTGDQLAVAVGIIKDVSGDVKGSLRSLGLEGVPLLSLHGTGAVTSPRQSNAVALALKEAMRNQITSGEVKKVHLFYAGPAHLALFFGHRLNAVAPIQCYEWTPRGYTPTCVI